MGIRLLVIRELSERRELAEFEVFQWNFLEILGTFFLKNFRKKLKLFFRSEIKFERENFV